MIRGTTPTITYNMPFDVSKIVKFRMYFIQGTETIITKDETACTITHTASSDTVSVQLTQADTFKFSSKKKLITRSRFMTNEGTQQTPVYVVGGTKSKEIVVEDTGGATDEILTVATTGTE